jgi:hypothetical protein
MLRRMCHEDSVLFPFPHKIESNYMFRKEYQERNDVDLRRGEDPKHGKKAFFGVRRISLYNLYSKTSHHWCIECSRCPKASQDRLVFGASSRIKSVRFLREKDLIDGVSAPSKKHLKGHGCLCRLPVAKFEWL